MYDNKSNDRISDISQNNMSKFNNNMLFGDRRQSFLSDFSSPSKLQMNHNNANNNKLLGQPFDNQLDDGSNCDIDNLSNPWFEKSNDFRLKNSNQKSPQTGFTRNQSHIENYRSQNNNKQDYD